MKRKDKAKKKGDLLVISLEPSLFILPPFIDTKDQEREVLRKTILELVKKGLVHYTDI